MAASEKVTIKKVEFTGSPNAEKRRGIACRLLLLRLAADRTLFSEERLPALLPDALPRRGAPLQAGWRRFAEHFGLALGADHAFLVREQLYHVAALWTGMQAGSELPSILSRAFPDRHSPPTQPPCW